MSEERKRIPTECKNRQDNNFRCALYANGTPKTPDAGGADCVNCPKYEYAPSREEEKAKVADSDAKKGAAFGTVVLAITAVLVAAGIFAFTMLIKSCVG